MSHQHNEEPIYTQDDLDNVLTKLRSAEKESEQARQLLWATVDAAGGEVTIPYRVWLESSPSDPRELIMWDDPTTFTMHLKTKRRQNMEGEVV